MAVETTTAPTEAIEAEVVDKKAAAAPKGRVERLTKPDRSELDSQIAHLQEQADKNQARIESIKATIEGKREKRKNVSQGTQVARARIAELNAAFSAHMDERNLIRKELLTVDAARERAKEEIVAIKQKLRFFRVDQIDAEIAKLEEAHAHTTMTLNEEKKIMTQIKDLAKSRETVKEFNEKQLKISEEEAMRKAIIDRIRAKDLDINAVKAEQMQYRQALDETRSKEDAAMADIPKLQEERNKAYETIKAKREEIRRLRTEFKAKEDEYWKREREFRAAQREEKQRRWEASQEERKAREEARKKWELENAPEPFEAEVTAAEQLVAYLAKWDAKEEKKEEEKKDFKLEGFVMLNKKHMDEEADPFFVASKPKGRGKAKKGKGANQLRENNGPDPNERLNLSFDAYSHFTKLSLSPPNTVGEVPATMKLLAEKKALFLEKRKLKKERIAAGIDDEEEERKKKAKEKAEKEAEEAAKAEAEAAEEAAKAEAEAEEAEAEAKKAAEEAAKEEEAAAEAEAEAEAEEQKPEETEEAKEEAEAAPADEEKEEGAKEKEEEAEAETAEDTGKVTVALSADEPGENVSVELTASEE